MSKPEDKQDERARKTEGQWETEILRAVREVKYGSVEIVIHDSRVVQVERREKIRFQGSEQNHRQHAS